MRARLIDRRLAVRGASAALTVVVGLALLPVLSPAVAQDDADGLDQEMAGEIQTVIDSVGPIRELEPTAEVPVRVVDRDTFRAELDALFREDYTPEYLVAEDALLTRLGLIPPDADLEELMLSLYESQVLAYYDPRTGAFTIVGPVERIGPFEEIIVAHEFTHALQDQRWDLEGTRVTDLSQADEILAQQSLIEGDATALMFDWATRELDLSDLMGIAGTAFTRQDASILARTPPIMRRQLESPYLDGCTFVNTLRQGGGWAAVDTAFDHRPASTEQILHPELYPDEQPVGIELPDIATALGPDWTASYTQTLGEMQMGVWLADGATGQPLLPCLPIPTKPSEAAAGWGGDRLVSLDGPDGAWAVVWQTAWDSGQDATEFHDAAVAAMQDLDGSDAVLDASIAGDLSAPVLVLVADGERTLQEVRTALGLEE